ncbi:uncharacterized protein LOC124451485 [Xenia sp. Carnegie-2017]|uniref:uncharacterized protein LOC124451485 n=1 Tax=Xenia sp. Carnegie-2017 TaxID=2897299 RepID=UPI001F03E723|nr:uncharacterized protein LOC124451485 [Xenia sp. Carnegie-2017]
MVDAYVLHHSKRRLQKEQLILKVESNGNFDAREYKCNKTVYTEFSDGESGKRRIVIKKFIDEETSKESDRGLEMTPKSSYLFLDSEKVPFLQRTVNRDASADTSCDSQDSGVQTFRNKKFRDHGTHKDSGKLSKPSKDAGVVVETTC